jgi:hemerythrin
LAELIHSVAWTTDSDTGNEEIDLQHQYLFGMLSDLINICSAGDRTEK